MFNVFLNQLKYEKIHYQDDQITISSTFNYVIFKRGVSEIKVVLPVNLREKCLGLFRITRRLFRLDMCNVFLSERHLIIIRRGWVYSYDLSSHKLTKTLELKQCRNILHQSICEVPNGDLYGEFSSFSV